MSYSEKQYLDLLRRIHDQGVDRGDRTGTGTRAVFDARMEFDLSQGHYPLFTSKYVNYHAVEAEMEWFLSGSDNVNDLIARGCHIWDHWMLPLDEFDDAGYNFVSRPYRWVAINSDRSWFSTYDINEDPDRPQSIDVRPQLNSTESVYSLLHDVDIDEFEQRMMDRYRAISPMSNPNVRVLSTLWHQLFQATIDLLRHLRFDQSINSFYQLTLQRHASVGLSYEMCDPQHFIDYVLQLPNVEDYIRQQEQGLLDDETSNLILTGIYYLDPYIHEDTAIFLPEQEIHEYLVSEAKGITRVCFENKGVSKIAPQYFLPFGDIFIRLDDSIQHRIQSTETVSSDYRSNKRLRYARSYGFVGPIYGYQWRKWGTLNDIDQIQDLVYGLRKNPDSRRYVVSAWDVEELQHMALAPCHYVFQCFAYPIESQQRAIRWVSDRVGDFNRQHNQVPTHVLDLKFTMRSVDMMIGAPFNVASYALLLIKLAACVGMVPGRVIFDGGDCHIYHNHFDGMKEQVQRDIYKPPIYTIVRGWLSDDPIDVEVIVDNYRHQSAIPLPIAV